MNPSRPPRCSTNEKNNMYLSPNLIGNAHARGLESAFETHTHPQYEIYIFHNGNGQYLIEDHVFELEPGMIILLDGTEAHRVHITSNEHLYERSLIHFNPGWLASALQGLNAEYLLKHFTEYHHRIFKLNPKTMREVMGLVRKIEQLSNSKITDEVLADSKIILMYLLMILHRAEKTDTMHNVYKKTEKAELAEKIAMYIKRYFNKKWTIKDLARDLNVSESYVSHLFKAETGYTVMEYLKKYRIEQAKAFMLLSPEESTIKDCARVCGFESDAHFNRFFKKETGMTPNTYKKIALKQRQA